MTNRKVSSTKSKPSSKGNKWIVFYWITVAALTPVTTLFQIASVFRCSFRSRGSCATIPYVAILLVIAVILFLAIWLYKENTKSGGKK